MTTNTLTTSLSAQINKEHQACVRAARQALDHAMRCGDLLVEAKAGCPHGEWQPWLAEHFDGSARSARGYMRLANNRELLEPKTAESAVLSIDGALKLLSGPREIRRYPPETDDPGILLTDPDAYQAMQQRHSVYFQNAKEYMDECVILTEHATKDDLRKLWEIDCESKRIANGWACYKLKLHCVMASILNDFEKTFGKKAGGEIFSLVQTDDGNKAFRQLCEERIAELEATA